MLVVRLIRRATQGPPRSMQRVRGLIAQVQPASASSQRPSVRDIRDLDLESMSKEELVVLLKQLDRYNRAEERFSETEVLQQTYYKVMPWVGRRRSFTLVVFCSFSSTSQLDGVYDHDHQLL